MATNDFDPKDNPSPKWNEYAKRTSVLTVPRVLENFSSKINRACWAMVFVAGITMTIYNEYQLVATYLAYQSQISVHFSSILMLRLYYSLYYFLVIIFCR